MLTIHISHSMLILNRSGNFLSHTAPQILYSEPVLIYDHNILTTCLTSIQVLFISSISHSPLWVLVTIHCHTIVATTATSQILTNSPVVHKPSHQNDNQVLSRVTVFIYHFITYTYITTLPFSATKIITWKQDQCLFNTIANYLHHKWHYFLTNNDNNRCCSISAACMTLSLMSYHNNFQTYVALV